MGIISVDFDATSQPQIYIPHSSNSWEKKGIQWNSAVSFHWLQEI